MDAVYILGSGSLVDDAEIRYSLRSLERYMLDLRYVYVIGERPDFLRDVRHISAVDSSVDKWQNAYKKVRLACEIPELSDDFLLLNDDFFMLETFTGAEWPFYSLRGSNGGTCGQNSFHVHCPIRLNKQMYARMPYDPQQRACRSPRSFYANIYRAPATPCDDFILRVGRVMRPADDQIKDWPCFSVGDSAMLEPEFRLWLEARYPQPSRFEQ